VAPKIGTQPRAPQWPWGGPRSVRERLVDKSQLDRKTKKGDPRNPPLASAALLDFIGPAHSAEELRLPMPPMPKGHDADVDGLLDRGSLAQAAQHLGDEARSRLQGALEAVRASSERVDRLRSLLQREAQMLELVSLVSQEMAEIERKRREETAEQAY
jgi:hypothetical protein